jgi:tRNA-2-methylthio-N6-dimethylallyladenosine synthase
MAETPTVMPQLHMPLQSGSDRILKAMRRSYRSDRYLRILDAVRDRIPDAAITTDIIVGFPGETEEDFEDTLRVVEQSRFASAFTFQYSIRPGTPAAIMPHQVPKQVVQERYERLTALQDRMSWTGNRDRIGTEVEVLVAAGEGRKDGATHRLSGRARDNRLVHVGLPDGSAMPRPGDLVTVRVTDAAPAYLIADVVDGGRHRLERTRAGDAWDAREAASCAVPTPAAGAAGGRAISLGLPVLRAPLG